jgi:MYXO-CTERM domain-containing protein
MSSRTFRHHCPALLAVATLSMAVADRADAAATFAYFNPTNLGEGTIDGVDFTVTVDANGGINSTSTANLNSAAYDFAGSRPYLDYFGTTVTINFDQAISDLNLYLYFFRGDSNPTNSGTGGADSYTFNQSFSINANFVGGTQNGNVLETPGSWANGVLSFSGQITSLSWTSSSDVSGQGFTFSGTAAGSSSPVPGPGGLLAAIGLAGAARRRRR